MHSYNTVVELKATDLKLSPTSGHKETSIDVTWQTTAFLSQYQAMLNTGDTSPWGTDAHFNFTGLTPGTTYTFKVTARITRNPGHSDYASVTSDNVTVYTSEYPPSTLLQYTHNRDYGKLRVLIPNHTVQWLFCVQSCEPAVLLVV